MEDSNFTSRNEVKIAPAIPSNNVCNLPRIA